MREERIQNVKLFAEEFLACGKNVRALTSKNYKWNLDCEINDDVTTVAMRLYKKADWVCTEICTLAYDLFLNDGLQFTDKVLFAFEDVTIDLDEKEELEELIEVINSCEEGLYECICESLRNYALDKIFREPRPEKERGRRRLLFEKHHKRKALLKKELCGYFYLDYYEYGCSIDKIKTFPAGSLTELQLIDELNKLYDENIDRANANFKRFGKQAIVGIYIGFVDENEDLRVVSFKYY